MIVRVLRTHDEAGRHNGYLTGDAVDAKALPLNGLTLASAPVDEVGERTLPGLNFPSCPRQADQAVLVERRTSEGGEPGSEPLRQFNAGLVGLQLPPAQRVEGGNGIAIGSQPKWLLSAGAPTEVARRCIMLEVVD